MKHEFVFGCGSYEVEGEVGGGFGEADGGWRDEKDVGWEGRDKGRKRLDGFGREKA